MNNLLTMVSIQSPPHQCYISMLSKHFNLDKPPHSVSICICSADVTSPTPKKGKTKKAQKTPFLNFPSKTGSVTFLDQWSPTFIPKIRKFLGLVKAGQLLHTYGHTYGHTDRGYLIGPFPLRGVQNETPSSSKVNFCLSSMIYETVPTRVHPGKSPISCTNVVILSSEVKILLPFFFVCKDEWLGDNAHRIPQFDQQFLVKIFL